MSSSSDTTAFRARLQSGDTITRLIGVSDGLGARLAEGHGFDALWSSSLAVSLAHGLPDAGVLSMTEMLDASRRIGASAGLPVVADCDTGFGDVNVMTRMVREFEAGGIAAVCVEDKAQPKRNSLRGVCALMTPEEFSVRIAAAKHAQRTRDFMVFARIESFIAGEGLECALARGRAYADAGADALVVHSKSPTPDEALAFAAAWREDDDDLPLVVIPTTYPEVTCAELHEAGVSAVIYANQVLRASLGAVERMLEAIAVTGSTGAVEEAIAPLDRVFDLAETSTADTLEAWYREEVALRRAERAYRANPAPTVEEPAP